MTTRGKRVLAIGGGVVVLAIGAFFLLGNRDSLSGVPVLGRLAPDPTCPLTGEKPKNEDIIKRPAVAVKVENNPAAYPLSGIGDADVLYEELVEGGITRFMAIFHCGSASQVGPVRSARIVDPSIMGPTTRILADAGGNPTVRAELEKQHVVSIDETHAGTAMTRIDRPGYASEHTLYANVDALRKLARKSYDDPPPEMFSFGDINDHVKKAKNITLTFSASSIARYEWSDGHYLRFQGDTPLVDESGQQYAVENVLIEEHKINLSDNLGDVHGIPSTEIADVTGSGRAVLFRDGKAIVGTWSRKSVDDAVTFKTKSGDEMSFAVGTTWIELVPSDKGEAKGSFEYGK